MAGEEKRARWFALCVFSLIGLFASVVGTHDAFAALEVGSRFGGLMLMVAGSALVAAGVSQGSYRFQWAPTAGVFAGALGAMVGVGFILAQLLSPDRSWPPIMCAVALAGVMLVAAIVLRWTPLTLSVISFASLFALYLLFVHGDYDQRQIIWAGFVIASALAAYSLWRAHPPELSLSAPRLFAGIVGFFSLSALVGGAQFWYTSQYLPSSEGVSLTVKSSLRQLGHSGNMDIAELGLTVTNTSAAQADVLGSVYRISGSVTRPTARPDAQMAEWLGRPDVRGATISRYRRGPTWDLTQCGRIFADGWWLEPNETYSRNILIYVPRGRYDILRSQVQLLFAKRGALALRERDRHRFPTTFDYGHAKAVVTRWPIQETSWFRDLTRGERELSLIWLTGNDLQPDPARFPHIAEGVGRVGEEAGNAEFASYNDQAAKLYGLASTLSTRELPLDIRP